MIVSPLRSFDNKQRNKQMSFGSFTAPVPGGAYDKLVEGTANVLGKIMATKPSQALVKVIGKSNKPYSLLCNVASVAITLSNLIDIKNNKKIQKDRKPALMLNTTLVTIISSTMSIILDNATDNLAQAARKAFMENKGITEHSSEEALRELGKFDSGFRTLKSVLIFTLIVRGLVPTLIVPLTGTIMKKFEKSKEAKQNKNQVQEEANSNEPKKLDKEA